MRALIKVGGRCDSDCVFCHAGGSPTTVDLTTREICRRVLEARDAGCQAVVLSGGEPTVRRDISTLVRFIERTGLRVGLITNGRGLADPAVRDHLLAYGLDYVQVSLHGSRAEVHDSLSGVPSFELALVTLAALAQTGVELGVSTVVCRPNLDDLHDVVELVSQTLIRPEGAPRPRHRLALLEPKGRALERRDLWPDLGEASAAVDRAIERGRQSFGDGILRGADGFPLCRAPWGVVSLEDLRAHGIELVREAWEDRFFTADQGRRAYGEVCRACREKPRCPGVYEGYFPVPEGTLRPFNERGRRSP
jgi:MoaA/NifB/PqqE/SkfB family radical SAM enzyme